MQSTSTVITSSTVVSLVSTVPASAGFIPARSSVPDPNALSYRKRHGENLKDAKRDARRELSSLRALLERDSGKRFVSDGQCGLPRYNAGEFLDNCPHAAQVICLSTSTVQITSTVVATTSLLHVTLTSTITPPVQTVTSTLLTSSTITVPLDDASTSITVTETSVCYIPKH
jgi:hypothetical protein